MKTQNPNKNETLRAFVSDGTPESIFVRYASLRVAASLADYGDLDRNIVVIDTETTGFSLNHDELTQIAAARMEQGEITDWFITFVNPGKPIPEDVAHLTDIHDENVADAPSPSEVLAQLVDFVGDAKVVAHNAEFDRNFTTKHPSGYPLLENVWIDSLDLARIALPRMKSHRLIDLVRAFGLPPSTHRADADVAATCGLFRILLAAVDAMPTPLVREIARMASHEQWPTSVVFEHFANAHASCVAFASGNEGVGDSPASSGDLDTFALGREAADASRKERPFSLTALRRDRLRFIEKDMRPRVDADNLAADPDRGLKFPSSEEVEQAFTSEGVVGRLYSDFEPRREQAIMAEEVREAFASSENLVVEAGTGVGKSMAYLVPGVLTARMNNVTVGVATKTNTLLDQLIYHELPALRTHFDNLTYASLKGFSHYPCLRRVGRLVQEGAGVREVAGKEYSQAPALAALLSFIEQTEYDDMDGLKLDYRVLPRQSITTTSHDCLRRKCPFFGSSCFVHGARRRAEAVDIVVTNHSLLFCDLAAEGGLLPPVRYWVVDEAHGTEAEARRAFSLELAAEDLLRIARRVSPGIESSRDVFSRAERRAATLEAQDGVTLLYALANKARSAGQLFAQAAEEFSRHMKDLLFFDPSNRSKGYDRVEIWINDDVRRSETFSQVVSYGKLMSDAAEKLVTACQEIVGYLDDVEGVAEVQREIASIAMDLKDILAAAEVILDKAPERYVYAANLSRKNDRPVDKLEAMPVDVGVALRETLYENTRSVVFTSATLTVDGSFSSFESAVGLNGVAGLGCRSCRLDSCYDYDSHMTIYVVNDIPEPNEGGYLSALQELLVDVHRAQQGSMLTLFTNRREMEKCFEVVQPAIKEDDLRLVCQKWGVSVKGLRDDFLADEHLSLFALKSFWEGFDAPGATLKGVVIPKLPFAKPSDPLSCERAQRDDQAWRHYVLPAAVLETKQAAGRLIRKADDTGVLILADRRLITKGYGKAFLNSLPSRTIKMCSAKEIAAALSR